MRLDLLHHLLEAFLEVAAIAGAGEQRAHIEGEHRRVREHLRHFAVDDLAGEALGDGGLADAGVADQQRVVLLAPAQDLDRARYLSLAADQRIDLAVAGLLVEVDAIGVESIALLLGSLALLSARPLGRGFFLGAAHRLRLGSAGALGDAVADVVDRVVAGHVLLLQEVGGMALALGEDRHEHVRSRHLLATGGLHMDHRALDHALEPRRRLGVLTAVADQVGEFGIDIFDEAALQRVDLDIAGPHDGGGVLVVHEGEQEVLQRRIFVPALAGERQGAVESLF